MMIIILMLLFNGKNVFASEQIYFDENGNLIYVTYDKKATSLVSYKAIGWILKRYDAPIDAPGQQYVIVRKIEYAVDDPENPGYLYCYFWSDKEEILSAVEKVSKEWRKQLETYGNMVYIDNVMTVCNSRIPLGNVDENGNCTGEVYFTFEGISTSRPWARPEFLKSYFDIQLEFPILDYPPSYHILSDQIENYSLYSNSLSYMSVGSNEEGNQLYDISQAMPGGEQIYFKGSCEKYQYEVKLCKRSEYVNIPVRIDKKYIINWVDLDGSKKSETKTVSRWYKVPKFISYTTIDDFEIYDLYAVNMSSKLINSPCFIGFDNGKASVARRQYGASANHIRSTSYYTNVGQTVLSSGNYIKPSIPDEDYSVTAQNLVKDIMVRSDYLAIDGNVILSDAFGVNEGAYAKEIIPQRLNLYKANVPTDILAKNGLYNDFEMLYVYEGRRTKEHKEFYNKNINGVNIHTPIVCNGKVYGEKSINQAKNGQASDLVLGSDININVNYFGNHSDKKGYGAKNYSKYLSDTYVCFEFPVIKDGTVIEAGKWILINNGVDTLKLPENVKQGKYKVSYKAIALNGDENSILGKGANLDISQCGAYGTYDVNVIGRIYDLTVNASDIYVAGNRDKDGKEIVSLDKLILPKLYKITDEETVSINITTMGDVSLDAKIEGKIKYYYMNFSENELVPVDLYIQGDELNTTDARKIESSIYFENYQLLNDSNNTFLWTTNYTLPHDFVAVKEGSEIKHIENEKHKHLKNGVIFISFEFEYENEGCKTLLYINSDNYRQGYCNMWRQQGGLDNIEINEKVIDIIDGTLFVSQVGEKIKYDYEVNGTH